MLAAPAPSALKPPPSLGGKCGVFPRPGADVAADAPSLADQRAWNQDISGAPVAANSDAIIDYVGSDELHPDFGSPRAYGIPYKVVGKRAKRTKVKFTAYGDESDKGKYRVPLKAPVEGGANADGDRHVLAYDKARCKLYELYRAFPKTKAKRWEADSGVIWDLRSAGLRTEGYTSADAAGLPIFPGLVRYDEVAAGERRPRDPRHLRIDPRRLDQPRLTLRRRHRQRRRAADGPAPAAEGRLRHLAASPATREVIAEAFKRYGMIVADNGSDWFFQGSSDPRWDDDDLNQLKEIPGSAFEVVRSEAEVHAC